MAGVELKLDGRFQKKLRVAFRGHTADVGILEDRPHKRALTVQQGRKRAWKKDKTLDVSAAKRAGTLKTFAGGLARKTGSKVDGTMVQISEKLRKSTGINFYTAPFRLKQNKDILKFSRIYVQMLLGGEVSKKSVENLLQAIVRNPILRGDYGSNSIATAKAKGFNRFMIDTAQLFKNIKARVTKTGGK